MRAPGRGSAEPDRLPWTHEEALNGFAPVNRRKRDHKLWHSLEIKNLHVALEDGTEIVKGVDLAVDLTRSTR